MRLFISARPVSIFHGIAPIPDAAMSCSSSLRPLPASLEERAVRIVGGEHGEHEATLYRTSAKSQALVLHLHAGAFVSEPHEGLPCVVRLLIESGASVLSLHYPLAPQHPFPHAVYAAFDALAHLHRGRRHFGAANARVFVAGEEAGGNLAAAAALMARDRGEPPLAGQILFSPMLDACVGTASLRQANAGPVGCRWADGWNSYLPRATDAMHPYATPGAAWRISGLPRTLLVTASDDPMRDETRAFGERLRQQGVPTELLQLATPTEFPKPYLEPPERESDWAEPAREALRGFLLSTQPHGPVSPRKAT